MTVEFAFALTALACFRLAELIAVDEGPFAVFFRFRTWTGGYDLGVNGEPLTLRGRLVRCPYCVGIYVAAVASVILTWVFFPAPGNFVLCWFALAGAQSFLQTIGGRT